MAIWSSDNGEDGFSRRLHEICFKTNLDYDNRLLPYDIEALIAHGRMLGATGLISVEDSASIIAALTEMYEEAQNGILKMEARFEDCHSLIEEVLIDRIGDAGKRLYMARSRNDQVVCATRLYTKDRLKGIDRHLKDFMANLLEFSQKFEFAPMPGYTHTQRAMPSSVGMWASSYLETLLNQKSSINAAIELNDVNVLGSAAGYGTAFPIDRDFVTAELGLKRTQVNSLSAQLSRGQVECQTLQSLWGVMFVVNRMCNDLVWTTSAEFNFFKMSSAVTTGSSIMPNKKNLDPCEIIRARYHIFSGLLSQAQGVISNLFYGYNSDYQESKPVLMEGLDLVQTSIEALNIVICNTDINEEALKKAFDTDIFSTDEVNRHVMAGKTFRDAYREVKQNLDKVELEDPDQNIRSKHHLGATGNLGLDRLGQRLTDW